MDKHLTRRELEVLRLVAKHMTNRAIGEALGISEQTVKNHLLQIRERTGVRRRYQMVDYAREHGLLGLSKPNHNLSALRALLERPGIGDPILDSVTILKHTELDALLRIAEAADAMREFYDWDEYPIREHGIPEQALIEALDDLEGE